MTHLINPTTAPPWMAGIIAGIALLLAIRMTVLVRRAFIARRGIRPIHYAVPALHITRP